MFDFLLAMFPESFYSRWLAQPEPLPQEVEVLPEYTVKDLIEMRKDAAQQ